ncbi:unnamed protein product, partial [Linum tenue]
NRQNPVVCLFPWSGEDWRKSQTDFTDLQVSCEFCVAGRDAHVGFAVKNNGIPAIQKSSFLEAILEV